MNQDINDAVQNKLNGICNHYTAISQLCPGCPFSDAGICQYDSNDQTHIASVLEWENPC